jgi:hypothetical protein
MIVSGQTAENPVTHLLWEGSGGGPHGAPPPAARRGSGFRNRAVRLTALADTRLLDGHGDPLLRASRYASTPPVGEEVRPCHP